MPVYEYQCMDCAAVERRLAGPHDCAAICAGCAGLMLRLDEEALRLYFDKESGPVFFDPLKPSQTAQNLHSKFPQLEIFMQYVKNLQRPN